MAVDLDVRSDAKAVTEGLAMVRAGLEKLASADPFALGTDGLESAVRELHDLRGKFEASEAQVLHRWNLWGGWRASGAKSASAWLAAVLHLPKAVAGQRLRHGRAIQTYPAIGEAWAAGQLDRAHVTTLLGCNNLRTRAAFERDHEELLGHARTMGFIDFKRVCDVWSFCADPDGAEQQAMKDEETSEVHLSQSLRGTWALRGSFDPITGQIIDTTLKELEQELFKEDWAEAKERLGRKPATADLRRTPAQRRAVALRLMAERARTAPADGKKPRPLFNVLLGYETFKGPLMELYNRTVVHPSSLVKWLDEAEIERIVFDGPSRVIDVGQRRLFTGALRRAILVRDRTCFHPMCDEPPLFPVVDHRVEWRNGGETTQDNGDGGCARHNNDRNRGPDWWRIPPDDDEDDVPDDPDPP